MYDCNVDLTHSFSHLEHAGKMIFLTGLSGLEVFVGLSIPNTTFECRRDINFKSNNAIYCPLSAETKATNVTSL